MRTEQLIAGLAADLVPSPPVAATLARALPVAGIGAALMMLAFWGLRPGLAGAMAEPLVVAKMAIPGLVAVAGTLGALRLARPEGRARGHALALTLLAVLALGLVAWALGATPRGDWAAAVRGSTLAACLRSIPALALLPLMAALLSLRRGASTRGTLAGLLAGLGAGGLGAAVYALHCPEDSPLFYVPWYGTGILVAGLAGALIGRRWLRW